MKILLMSGLKGNLLAKVKVDNLKVSILYILIL